MKKETKVILTILVNNVVDESTLLAEHGISILVTIQNEIGFYDTIMDTGQKSATLLYNIKELNIDISKLMINSIIISHGHYDHTGGLKNLLKNLYKHNPIPVIAHPDIFIPRISYLGGFRSISCPFTPSEIRQAGGELLLTRDPVKINNYLTTTGEVPRKNKYEINPLFRKIVNDQWIEDEVDDDLSLIINVNKESFFLLCGCCHAGLINTLARAKELTGKSKCYGIMGGLHL
ncbi:MBL fold metallo-hydrolase, partial [Candidatus Bathyarchaeota archaeon]|nr:MBL fold metallo-hydrolase [Candidatus Bathyarchaeota archaeon]